MRLYDQVERILNELRELGIDEDAPLSVEDLTPFDQYHYHGVEAVDEAAKLMGAVQGTEILEIGSGIGGPARHMANRIGCAITALELQPDLNRLADDLTRRCGLSDRVTHVCANFLDDPWAAGRSTPSCRSWFSSTFQIVPRCFRFATAR